MYSESLAEYDRYKTGVYDALRLRELGFDAVIPKLEGNFVDKYGKPIDVSCLSYESLLMNFAHH